MVKKDDIISIFKKITEQPVYKKIIEQPVYKKIAEYVQGNKRTLQIVGILLLVMFITAHVRGALEKSRKNKVEPRPVQTAVAFKKTVPIYEDSFGTLSSPEDVDIRSQVTGKILEVNFTQGKEVSAGDLLFTIDQAPYKADLDKAEASLAEDTVTLQLKRDTLERNKKLVDKGLISAQEYEQYQTETAANAAQVDLDKADIESAQINLAYCYVRSPINGLTGKRQVDVGNIVPANTGPVLVNVKKIDELYLDFTLPERDLSRVRKAMGEEQLDVQITVPGEEQDKFQGKLEFIDNDVDENTGTFALRAIVNNEARGLWPGQFVDVRLVLGSEKDAVLVPYDAAQIGKKGYYVFVVGKGNKADLRQVTVGSRQGDNIVIEKGVKDGEKVITVGQLGLAPGMLIIDITKWMEEKEKKAKAKEKK